MKVSEFKKILKPLIEQTVKEVLLQEGVLSKIVSEVATGLRAPLVENKKNTQSAALQGSQEEYEKNRQEKIRRLNESTKLQNVNVFENVSRIPENNPQSPLSGVAPSDSGIDISAIQTLSRGKWKRLAGEEDV
jgi:hypothetical protein|tara:strand:- start:875 stop:1273 length:399 start_codon:yes stop_codon:yes gene_type:complete